jgi:hypothetical protein
MAGSSQFFSGNIGPASTCRPENTDEEEDTSQVAIIFQLVRLAIAATSILEPSTLGQNVVRAIKLQPSRDCPEISMNFADYEPSGRKSDANIQSGVVSHLDMRTGRYRHWWCLETDFAHLLCCHLIFWGIPR